MSTFITYIRRSNGRPVRLTPQLESALSRRPAR